MKSLGSCEAACGGVLAVLQISQCYARSSAKFRRALNLCKREREKYISRIVCSFFYFSFFNRLTNQAHPCPSNLFVVRFSIQWLDFLVGRIQKRLQHLSIELFHLLHEVPLGHFPLILRFNIGFRSLMRVDAYDSSYKWCISAFYRINHFEPSS